MIKICEVGKVAVVAGAQTGSEAKANISSYVAKNERPDCLLTANSRNSSHTVTDPNVRALDDKFVFKVLPCGAFYYGVEGYTPTIIIGPGAAFRPEDLQAEVFAMGIKKEHLIIHENAGIVTASDINYENGVANFEGQMQEVNHDSGTTKHGTTGSGSGACRAKKALRKAVIARDIEQELGKYATIANGPTIVRFLRDKSALLDGSQGYLLGYNTRHYPHTTSRSCTVASFLSEMDLPPSVCGNVVGVARVMPIRINSKRFFDPSAKKFMTWSEVEDAKKNNIPFEIIDSNSGGWYADQCELSWEEVSKIAGEHIEPELTSLTKLPRRIATWSRHAIEEWALLNRPPSPHKLFLAVTFVNYLGFNPVKNDPSGYSKLEGWVANSGIDAADIEIYGYGYGPNTDQFMLESAPVEAAAS